MGFWKRIKPAVETAEHIHFGELVLNWLTDYRPWILPLVSGSGGAMTFIWSAVEGKSAFDVWLLSVGVAAALAFVVYVILLLAEKYLKRGVRSEKMTATLSISGPHLLRDARYQNKNQWRMKVHNTGPAAARNVQMKLRNGESGLKDPTWTGDYPYPVYPVGTITNDPAHINAAGRQINADDDEMYEIVCGWKSEYGQLFTDLNTKGGGHNLIQIASDERWKLFYEVTAENAPSVKFVLHIFVENDQVKAIGIR